MEFSHIFNSKSTKIIAFFALFLAFFTSNAQNHVDSVVQAHEGISSEVEHVKEKLDINSFILHHIADANEFHFFGEGENWKGIYLPIILWTDKGLVTFSAKEFKLDHEGSVVVNKGGQKFTRYHNKIYYASNEMDHGSYLDMSTDEKGHHIVANEKPWAFSITKNVFTIF